MSLTTFSTTATSRLLGSYVLPEGTLCPASYPTSTTVTTLLRVAVFFFFLFFPFLSFSFSSLFSSHDCSTPALLSPLRTPRSNGSWIGLCFFSVLFVALYTVYLLRGGLLGISLRSSRDVCLSRKELLYDIVGVWSAGSTGCFSAQYVQGFSCAWNAGLGEETRTCCSTRCTQKKTRR